MSGLSTEKDYAEVEDFFKGGRCLYNVVLSAYGNLGQGYFEV